MNQTSTDSEVALGLLPRVRASPQSLIGLSSALGVEGSICSLKWGSVHRSIDTKVNHSSAGSGWKMKYVGRVAKKDMWNGVRADLVPEVWMVKFTPSWQLDVGIKNGGPALARWLIWLEHHLVHQKLWVWISSKIKNGGPDMQKKPCQTRGGNADQAGPTCICGG